MGNDTALQERDEVRLSDIERHALESEIVEREYTTSPAVMNAVMGLLRYPAAADATIAHIQRLTRQVAGPTPTPLEQLLAERVAASWWHLQRAEITISHLRGDALMEDTEPYYKRLERAQRMYLSAVVSLAKVRRLQVPDVQVRTAGQVNVASQQVNIAEDARMDRLEAPA